jgi:intracellular multiplication protein IcmT
MGTREDTEEERANWHWRNSMRPARFFAFDARCAIPYFVLLFHARWSTLFIAIVTTIVFWAMERKGLTFDASLRAFRCWFLGQKRPAWIRYRRKKMVDYG